MRTRWLVLCAVVSLVLIVATAVSRVELAGAGGPVPCPERVWSSLVAGADDGSLEQACTLAAQERMFRVAAALMGLVLISGLLNRRQ